VTELTEGLTARCQNGWPSVNFDVMSALSLAAPLLGAGFYYKTFMGPRRGSWMFYEPFIRRAAGLGRGVHAVDPDRYETRHGYTDVLVVGAGPAGLSAALAAAGTGARVLLVDQDFLVGGNLLSERGETTEGWLRSTAEALARSRREHQVERLRRRDQDVRWLLHELAPLLRRRVAGADPDATHYHPAAPRHRLRHRGERAPSGVRQQRSSGGCSPRRALLPTLAVLPGRRVVVATAPTAPGRRRWSLPPPGLR
jgi:sarcosine oxidase subunit alpha